MGEGQSETTKESLAIHNEALQFSLDSNGTSVRPIEKKDLKVAADICQESFNSFNASVALDPEFPPQEVSDVPAALLGQAFAEGFAGFVAVNKDGEIVGSNIVEMRDEIAGIGPITVKTGGSNTGVGKLLMKACMKAAAERGMKTVRLHGISENKKSFSLYLGLGFEPICMCGHYEGVCTVAAPVGFTCEPLNMKYVGACSELHFKVCGVHRRNDITAMIGSPFPNCVVLDAASQVVAYSTGCSLSGHTVADSGDAFKSLIVFQSTQIEAARGAGAPLPPTTLFVPHENAELMKWLARSGFRLKRHAVQMGYGPYVKPDNGFYFPAIQY